MPTAPHGRVEAFLRPLVQIPTTKNFEIMTSLGTEAVQTPLQCAKRWQHNLDPKIKHGNWVEKEASTIVPSPPPKSAVLTTKQDEGLLNAVKRYGRRWKRMQTQLFPDRSRNDLKNR
ncbi:hypothetical protein GGS24DRAFT_506151 [Hypoxylon argillaceum]|nr:hypothetical protein GGS24DRAFT_506151 [Hypoxylon argillaceum]